MKKNIFKAWDRLMRYLLTLNVHYVLVHNVHYALLQSKQNKLTNQVTHNRVAICKIKLAAPYRGQGEYHLCRLNTSEESIALKSCGTDWEYLRPDGVFRGRCLPARWCTAQSKGKRLMCPREATQALACMLIFLYCLKYNYKIILILSMILCHYM